MATAPPDQRGNAAVFFTVRSASVVTELELVHKALVDARSRLAKYLGPEDALDVFDQACVLARLGGRWPQTADELLAVAVMLGEQHPDGGVVSATGSGLKITALLLGASGV